MSDWKKPIYESLSTEGNPAGDILRELSDSSSYFAKSRDYDF